MICDNLVSKITIPAIGLFWLQHSSLSIKFHSEESSKLDENLEL